MASRQDTPRSPIQNRIPDGAAGRRTRLAAALALAALAGASLSILPRLAWTFSASGVGRPADFGWLRLLVNALETAGLARLVPGHHLLLPHDLAIPGELLRLVTMTMLGNSLLAVAAILLVLWPLSQLARISPPPATRLAALKAGAVVLAAGPEYMRALSVVVFRRLLPEAPWSLGAAVLLAATLVAGLALGWLVWRLLRAADRAGRRPRLHRWGWLAALSPLGLAVCLLPFQRPTLASAPYDASIRPNILLISLDSLRADHLHCYGYARQTSPSIDRLAAEGARFETAFAPTSWTLPSHITLLTGLPPEAHGVIYDRIRLSSDSVTLPEVLRAAGYRTAALVSAPYLDAAYGYYQGFDYYDDFSVRLAHGGPRRADLAAERWVASPVLAEQAERVVKEWDRDGRSQPLFLFLHMWEPHYDYIPGRPYDRFSDPTYEGPVTGDFDQVDADLGPRDRQELVGLYDGEIRLVDDFIGRIVTRFRDLGVLDDTVVVVTADHGEEFFEHGDYGHRNNLHDESLLVPLVIRYPRIVQPGSVIGGQARLMDLAPTILSLAGVDRPAAFAAVAGEPDELPIDLSGHLADPRGGRLETTSFGDLHGVVASIRTEEFKLISYPAGSKSDELYRLADDPGEAVNVAAQEPDLVRALKAKLARWRSRQGVDDLAEHAYLTAEHAQKLRALGYLD